MGRSRRRLLPLWALAASAEELEAQLEERFAACPEALSYSDEEAEDLVSAAQCLDSVDPLALPSVLKHAGISFPAELAFDPYRLGWYMFRRWRDPELRRALLQRAIQPHYRWVARVRRRGGVQMLVEGAGEMGAPLLLCTMRYHGMQELIPDVLAALPPELRARRKALIRYGKLLLHRFLTEPEPPRRTSRWEQRKLSRRICLRDVQMRSLRRSLVALRTEQKELLALLRKAGQRDEQELDRLALELSRIRQEQKKAEEQHRAELAEQARRYEAQIERLRREVAAAERDYQETLALRRAWLQEAGGR